MRNQVRRTPAYADGMPAASATILLGRA